MKMKFTGKKEVPVKTVVVLDDTGKYQYHIARIKIYPNEIIIEMPHSIDIETRGSDIIALKFKNRQNINPGVDILEAEV